VNTLLQCVMKLADTNKNRWSKLGQTGKKTVLRPDTNHFRLSHIYKDAQLTRANPGKYLFLHNSSMDYLLVSAVAAGLSDQDLYVTQVET
jgi:hypothetical protein